MAVLKHSATSYLLISKGCFEYFAYLHWSGTHKLNETLVQAVINMKTLCLPSRNPFSFQQVTRNLRDFSGELESIPALLKKTPPTVIVDAPQAAPDGKGENNAVSAPPPILRIKDLLYGNDANNSYQDRQAV